MMCGFRVSTRKIVFFHRFFVHRLAIILALAMIKNRVLLWLINLPPPTWAQEATLVPLRNRLGRAYAFSLKNGSVWSGATVDEICASLALPNCFIFCQIVWHCCSQLPV